MSLLFKAPRTSQPQIAEIDWSGQFAGGLTLLVDQYGRDLVSSASIPATGALSTRVTEKGVGRSNGGTAYLTSATRNFVAQSNTAFSIVGEIALNATGQTNKYLAYAESGTGGYSQVAVIFGFAANSIEIYAPIATGTNPRSGSAIAITDTKAHTFGYSYDGSIFCGYLDGKEVFSRSITFSLSLPFVDLTGSLYSANASNIANATILKWATFSRGIGASALRQLTANPNQLLKPISRTLWLPGTVSAGGASTVTGDTSASYAIRAATTSDASASYALRAAITSDATASYLLRTNATSDTSAAYGIRAPITSDTSASYEILTAGAVTSDCTASYGIRGAVQSDASVAYELRGVVQSTLSAGYDIRTAVVKDASAAYALRGAVVSDLAGSYAVLALSAVTADLVVSYFVDGEALTPNEQAQAYSDRTCAMVAAQVRRHFHIQQPPRSMVVQPPSRHR